MNNVLNTGTDIETMDRRRELVMRPQFRQRGQRRVGQQAQQRSVLFRAVISAVIGAAMLTTGCVQQNPTVLQFIGNAVVLRQPGGGGGLMPGTCIVDQSQFFRTIGTMDLLIALQYDMYPELANNLQPTANVSGNLPQHLRADASLITLQGVETTVRVRRDNAGPYGATNALPTTTATSPGWAREAATDGSSTQFFTRTAYVPMTRSIRSLERGIGRFPAIPPEFGEDLRRAWFIDDGVNFKDRYTTTVPVIIKFQVEGMMADGTVVRSQPVEYAVNLCWGCLLFLPTTQPGVEDVDPVNLYQQCSNKQMTVEDFTPPCIPGNDEAIPCGFYCATCQANESLDTDTGAEFKCDRRFCPLPP
mgnify:CR=1 FL=1